MTTSCSFELDEEASETTGAGEGGVAEVGIEVGIAGLRTGEGVGRTMVGMQRVGVGAGSDDDVWSGGFFDGVGGGGGEGRRAMDATSGFEENGEGDGSAAVSDVGGSIDGGGGRGSSEEVIGLESGTARRGKEGRREEDDSTSLVVGIEEASGLGGGGGVAPNDIGVDATMVAGGGEGRDSKIVVDEGSAGNGEGGDDRGEEEETDAAAVGAGIDSTLVSSLEEGEVDFLALCFSRLERTCSAPSICSTFTALEGSTLISSPFSSPSSD